MDNRRVSTRIGRGRRGTAKARLAAQLGGQRMPVRDALGVPIPPVELADYERSLSAVACSFGRASRSLLRGPRDEP